MTTTRIVAVLVAAGVLGMAGCTRGASAPPAAAPPATSLPATPAPAGTTSQGVHLAGSTPAARNDLAGYDHAIVNRADPAGHTVTLDLVQFFSGEAAARACAADGEPAGGSPECHTYYVRNRNPALRTVPVSAHATVRVLRLATSSLTPVPGTLAEVAHDNGDGNLYRFRLAGGTITELTAVPLP